MKLAVVGSRGFTDYEILSRVIDELRKVYEITTIVSGGAKGADTLAEKYASDHGLELDIFPAKWKELGKKAGYARNHDIWNNSDFGVAFWDGQSKGTAHSFAIAKNQNKKLFVFNYSDMDFYLVHDKT